MNKQTGMLVIVALLLGAAYVTFFTDWFRSHEIQIIYRSKGGSVFFGLDKQYPLTSIKVVSAAEYTTNKYARALWHVISETNSVPVADFVYGAKIPGMKPKVPQAEAEMLEPNSNYRIFVQSGGQTGEKEFTIRR